MAVKNKRPGNWSLRQQLMVALIISMLLVAGIASVLQYQYETQNMRVFLERQNSKNFQLLHSAIIEPIISEDLPVLQEFVDLLVEQDLDLFSIKILNAYGDILINWQRSEQLTSNPLMSFKRKIVLEKQEFGELQVSWSVDHFVQLIEAKIFHTQLFLLAILALLTSIVMILVLRLAVSPIREINRKVADFLSQQQNKIGTEHFSSRELNQLNISVGVLGQAFSKQLLMEKDLRKAKLAIEQMSRRNDLILNSAGEGVYVIDSTGLAIFINPAAAEMTGWDIDELIGKGLHCLIEAPACSDKVVNKNCYECSQGKSNQITSNGCHIYASFVEGKTCHVNQDLFWRKDGHSFPVEYVSTPIIENAQVTGAVIVFKDISKRLEAEQKIQDSEALKQAMLASSLDAIINVDEQGLIWEFNKEAEIIFGYAREQVIGQSMVDLIVPEHLREAHNKGFQAYLQSGQSRILRQRIEVSAIRASGEEFPVELVITPITLHKKIFFTAFLSDITLRKQAEAAVEESRVAAEKANLAKSQFLAAMSHEIRTPLNAMIGGNDLLASTALTTEQAGYVQIANQSGFALREIINNILDFSKIEAGKLELELLETDLLGVIDSVLVIMAAKALEKKLELMVTVDYPIPDTVLLDPVRLKQVLLNLLSNAIKFTESGFVRIHLAMTKNSQGEDAVIFSVIDTGVGISAEKTASVFDEFTQADLSTTRKYGGSGLGLAIAQRLVNMSGGSIGVESEEGKGSRFWFTLTPPYKKLIQPELIANLACWVFDSGLKSTQALYSQLSYLVPHLHWASSCHDITLTKLPCMIFVEEQQLPFFKIEEISSFLSEQDCQCIKVLITDAEQRQVDDEWLDLFDQQLVKPIQIEQLRPFLLACVEVFKKGDNKEKIRNIAVSKTTKVDGAGSDILLVEDSLPNQMVIKALLEKMHFKVDIADNGLVSTEKAKEKKYNLIFMDLSMPVMGGIDAAKTIRQNATLNVNTPIIALTANAFSDDRKQCQKVGMNGFLAKPLTMESLQLEVSKYLSTSPNKIDKSQNDSSSSLDSTEVIDLAVLKCLKEETSEDIFPELLSVFLQQGEKRIAGINKACTEKDFALLASEVHAFKSETATFGAIELGRLTQEINLLCKQQQKEAAFIQAQALEAAWKAVKKQLQKLII